MELGQSLYTSVFTGDVGPCFQKSLHEANIRETGLRLRLRLERAKELLDLPWEYLYDPSAGQFLVLSAWTPIVRYPEVPASISPLEIEPPLRILVLMSQASPPGLEPLDVDEEYKKLEVALADLTRRGLAELDRVPDGTLSGLNDALRKGLYHVFHYMGHGAFDEYTGGALLFESPTGGAARQAANDVAQVLGPHRSLRLAVFNSCEGARESEGAPFSGVAQSLLQKGLPAAIAMQFEITDEAAITFAEQFYSGLAEGAPVDAAVGEARRNIFSLGNDVEWGTPVLFLRSQGTHLFEITQVQAQHTGSEEVAEREVSVPKLREHPRPGSAAEVGDATRALANRLRIKRGFDLAVEAAASTLGPVGAEVVVIGEGDSATVIRGGGPQIVNAISSDDPLAQLGVEIAREVAKSVRMRSGVGTTTALVLAQKIASVGVAYESKGFHPLALKRGIEKAVSSATAWIEQLSWEIESRQDIYDVVTTAAADSTIGEKVADALDRVGKNGLVTLEEGQTPDITLELVEGMRVGGGLKSAYFVTDEERMEAVLEEPYILLTDQRLSSVQDILPFLEKVIQTGNPLAVIAEEVEGEALATLIVNKLRGSLQVAAASTQSLSGRSDEILRDIAVLTGGRVISAELGQRLQTVDLDALGRARRVVMSKDETSIVEGRGSEKAIEARINHLQAEIERAGSDALVSDLQLRLARLAGGVAILKVGAMTEGELDERMRRTEAGMFAAFQAVRSGVVPGAGASLVASGAALRDFGSNDEERAGAEIVTAGLIAPAETIVANAGLPSSSLVDAMMADAGHGRDVRTGEFVELRKNGITDPTAMVTTALQEGAAGACRLLTMRTTQG